MGELGVQLRCVLDDAVWQMNLQTFPLPKLVGHGHGHGYESRRRKLAHRVAKIEREAAARSELTSTDEEARFNLIDVDAVASRPRGQLINN